MASLASFATGHAGPNDPFGLTGQNAGPPGPPPPGPPSPPGAPPPPTGNGAGQQQQPPTPQGYPTTGTSGEPAPPPQYDISTDPVLQQVYAMTQRADQNAQASALAAREQALLAYGDPTLAAQILGGADPNVLAAGRNTESELAQLARGRDQALNAFDTTLDPSLAFSGYRVASEGQLGQNYQDALARAAAAIQSQLGGITDTLNSSLGADEQQREQALADAYARAVAAALANQSSGG
jgi:hypothetical protein